MAVQWYYQKLGQEIGPISASELKQLATNGQLRVDDLVRKEGLDKWFRADKVQGLFPLRSVAVLLPPVPPPLPVANPVKVLKVLLPSVEPPPPPVPVKAAKVLPEWEPAIIKAFRRFVEAEGCLLVFPEIPSRTLAALKEYGPFHPNETPLCLYVPNLSSLPLCWMITTQHIYDMQHSTRRKLPLRKVRARDIEYKKSMSGHLMQIDDSIALTIHGLKQQTYEGLEDFLAEGSALAREHAEAIDRANWKVIYGREVLHVESLFIKAFEESIDERTCHLPEDLTLKLLIGARLAYAFLNPHELILGLLDITGRGTALLGCAITNHGVYWKTGTSGAEHVRYDQLDLKQLRRAESFTGPHDGSEVHVTVCLALREMLKKPFQEPMIAFLKKAVKIAHEFQRTIADDTLELTALAERRLGEAPLLSLDFRCAGCGVAVEVTKLGTIDCPCCCAVLDVPKHSPCPKCHSKNTEFTPDRSPSFLTRISVGLAAHATLGLMGGAVAGHFLIAAMTSKAGYGCRNCKHMWALRLTRGGVRTPDSG